MAAATLVQQPTPQSFNIEEFLAAEESKGLLRLTTAGSVFVLRPRPSRETDACLTVREWLATGLPLPAWAEARYARNDQAGDHWTNCPYLPENGYGQVAVNLGVHWDLQPNGFQAIPRKERKDQP